MRLFSIFRQSRLLTASLIAAACMACVGVAHADDYSEVSRMLRAGQVSEANTKVDQLLAAKPNDPQIRFFKGVIQSEQGKPQDAIATFTKLTEDFPELPEPYNNLAVLYAGQSQFDKARAALEMAIRTNPSYATAHENLGDVYAKLASQAYSKALQLDSSNVGLQPKLALIKEIFTPGGKTVRVAANKMPPVAMNKVAAQPPVVAAVPTVRATPMSSAAATTAAIEAAATSAKVPVVVAAPPLAANKSAQPPVVKATKAPKAAEEAAEKTSPAAQEREGETAAVESAVHAWAHAWANKNTKSYFAAYASNFKPTGGASRSAWEAERKDRIDEKKNITVRISDLRVAINGDKATARFHQDYRGDSLHISSAKSLALVKEGSRWVIVREMAGN